MASRSRVVQAQLEELEKLSAPFGDQLTEAAKFIGVHFEEDGRLSDDWTEAEKISKFVPYRREEWLLIWLLKKLNAEEAARRNSSSWWLLSYIVKVLPVRTAARLLAGRDVVTEEKPSREGKNSVLLQTLEESITHTKDATFLNSEDKSTKASKKRKNTGELVDITEQSHSLPSLLEAISAFLDIVVTTGNVISGTSAKDVGAAMSAAYMKTVITTQAEKAAIILGSWLSLCNLAMSMIPTVRMSESRNWLTPFIDMWESRIDDETSLTKFSLYCTRPLLSLLRSLKNGHFSNLNWLAQVERLVAKNIIIPAKATKASDAESDLLNILIKEVVIEDPANASLLFEIAIRSIQPHGSKRRSAQENAWLQNVFDTLRSLVLHQTSTQNRSSIEAMLEFAILHKINLDLQGLRAITIQFAIADDREDWGLLATLIKLDANVFLIPNEEDDLLKALLERITKVSLDESWPNLSELVVSQVLVPLIGEFSKARDLSGFIQHWYTQLVQFESLRKETKLFSLETFSAWENDAVQAQLKRLFEPSLNLQQINQILDWINAEVSENPDAVCVILEAIAGAISSPEVIDQVSLRLYHIMFDNSAFEKLDTRYSWRSWRILSQTLDWALPSDVIELGKPQNKKVKKPFKSWLGKSSFSSLLAIHSENKATLHNLESLRCAGAALSASEKGSQIKILAEAVILENLKILKQDLKQFIRDLAADSDLGDESCGSIYNTIHRGIGWTVWSFVHCIFIEYPKMLCLGLSMETDSFKDIIRNVLWIASAGFGTSPEKLPRWLKLNQNAFSDLWIASLQSDEVLNNKNLVEIMIDEMLCNDTNLNNPLLKSLKTNLFVFRVLNHIPLDIFSKMDRERIMRGFLNSSNQSKLINQGSSSQITTLDPIVLAFKRRVMENHPNLYEGLEFKTMIEMADFSMHGDVSTMQVNLAILKDLVRLSLSHAHKNLDQTRRRTHVTEAFHIIQKQIRKASEKKKNQLTYGQIAVFEAALREFQKKVLPLDELGIIVKGDLETLTSIFKEVVLAKFKDLLHSLRKAKSGMPLQRGYLQIVIDSLASIGVNPTDLANLTKEAQKFLASKDEAELEARKRLKTFLAVNSDIKLFDGDADIDFQTLYGRESIKEMATAEVSGKSRPEKLELLHIILREKEALPKIDKLLTAKHIVSLIEDVSTLSRAEQDGSGEDADETEQGSNFDLTKAYIVLSQQLQKSTNILQFCIISETLEIMMKTKPRAISQYTIDLTLSAISILCSPTSSCLSATRSGTIYLHLCALLRTILTQHRLKLKGHFPLLQLAMQGLLRCLFRPLPHSNINIKPSSAEFGPAPAWLSSPTHQLTAKHAEAYTRLLTLICDPSVSSVRSARHNNLTSATEKWKRMSLLFMRFVLMDYIKWQLEMHMLPEIREKLVPGIYAIFDSTTLETRRLVSSELNTSERAVFATLYRDYQKFGKWKGS